MCIRGYIRSKKSLIVITTQIRFDSCVKMNLSSPQRSWRGLLSEASFAWLWLEGKQVSVRGTGNITVQGSEFKAGMYLYALIADGKVIDTKRMILTK
jgi:hypothetical protein